MGVEQEGNGKRHRLVGKREFIDTDFAKVQMQVERFLESYYNLQKTVVICNSENGPGYVRSSFENMAGECGQFEFFVDPYHAQGAGEIGEVLWNVREQPQTVFLPDEKARPVQWKGRMLSHGKGLCGPAK